MLPVKIAFIDRDGTLIWEPPETKQIDRLDKLRLLPGAVEGLRALREAGYALVMVTNQNGIGTPAFPQEAFDVPQAELLRQLGAHGIEFESVRVCPHRPDDGCDCRKPRTALVRDFVERDDWDRGESLVVGDRDTDEEFARALGVAAVRVQTNTRFPRFASSRRTKETDLSVFLNLDGRGRADVGTGIGFLDHVLTLLAGHALIDLKLRTAGAPNVDKRRTTEDTAGALGSAVAQALGDRRGIERYGFWVPMDEALAEAVLDLAGRPAFVFHGKLRREYVGGLPTALVPRFFEAFAQSLHCGLHLRIRRGANDEHKVAALFIAFGRALRQALRGCPHEPGGPSTAR